MKLTKLTENKVLVYSLILTIIILSIIPAIRFFVFDNILIGENSYYHIRISQYILEKGMPLEDPLVDAPYLMKPLHLVLAGFFSFLGAPLSSFLVPLLLGILSVVIFYFLLKELRINILSKFFSLFILIISPVFIYTFSTLNSYSLSVFILLLAFLLFMKKSRFGSVLSLILFVIIPFFNTISFIFGVLILLVYILNNKKKRKQFYSVLWIIIPIALVRYLIYLIKYGAPYLSISSTILINYLSELGGFISFGIFNLLLSLIGFYLIWLKKKQILGYILLVILIVFSLYFNSVNLYLNFIFAIAAGYAFIYIVKMEYSLTIIKKLTIALLLFGLIFSTVSYIAVVSNSLPNKSIINSLEWLKSNSKPKDIVFSHYTKGNWIEYFSERPVLLDPNLLYIEDVKTKLNDSETIFYSRTLKKTVSLLNQYDISYILIDLEMKQGQVWTKEDEGLLFLFRNKETFRKVYSKEGIEIWEVKKK
jgi:asparagine N-glycosylation enzyme membrane subunit Stt3